MMELKKPGPRAWAADTETVSFRLTPGTRRLLRMVATHREMTQGEIMERAFQSWLDLSEERRIAAEILKDE